MIYDEKRKADYENDEEKKLHDAHSAEFGPITGKVHQDDCDYCEEMGWDTHPEKTTAAAKESQRKEHMAEYGPMTGKSHPNDCGKCN